ncbi:MAG: hypothetical protein M3Z85_04090 [Acidobacteriota bacterium]|nr:hypothetical protein [Acidobacteriota bacterium]
MPHQNATDRPTCIADSCAARGQAALPGVHRVRGIGVFEVGLALRGKQELGLTQYQIAMMFTECSLVIFVVQAIVFSRWIKPETTRWFIAPALAVLAAGLFLVSRASDFMLMLAVSERWRRAPAFSRRS